LLGVSGSIAAYKAVYLTRLLVKAGASVQVIITESAEDLVTPLTFSTLSRSKVHRQLSSDEQWDNHVALGLWADLFIVAPATANTISKFATGSCTDMLSAVYLSARCPIMIAPAMDEDMWRHAATQRNVHTLASDGVQFLPVNTGELASGLVGPGRMAEPDEILTQVEIFFKKKSRLTPLTALVTAGPTYEDIDPVRYIGNRSSGKMGIALAKALSSRGVDVHLIIGPTRDAIRENDRIKIYRVRSAEEMAEQSIAIWPSCQVAVLAAAVADYRPAGRLDQKLKKSGDMTLRLVRTPDIAVALAKAKTNHQITVGFALETENELENAAAKLHRKKFDFIVLNSPNDRGAGFEYDTNKVSFVYADGSHRDLPLKQKTEVANDIVEEIEQILAEKKQIT